MKEYSACVVVDGWVEVCVQADDLDAAKEKMHKAINGMRFGDLRDVEYDLEQADISCDAEI